MSPESRDTRWMHKIENCFSESGCTNKSEYESCGEWIEPIFGLEIWNVGSKKRAHSPLHYCFVRRTRSWRQETKMFLQTWKSSHDESRRCTVICDVRHLTRCVTNFSFGTTWMSSEVHNWREHKANQASVWTSTTLLNCTSSGSIALTTLGARLQKTRVRRTLPCHKVQQTRVGTEWLAA